MEDEYNKRFKNNEMSNGDFDAAGLWDDIAEELDAPDRKVFVFPWKYLGTGLFLMFTIFGIYWLTSDTLTEDTGLNQSVIATQNETLNNGNKSKSEADLLITEKKTLAEKAAEKAILSPSENPQKTEIFTNNSVSNTNEKKGNQNYTNTEISEMNKNSFSDKSSKNEFPELLTIDKSLNTKFKENSPTAEENLIIYQKKNTSENFALLQTDLHLLSKELPTLSDSLLLIGLKKAKEDWDKRVSDEENNKRKIALTTGLYGGINRTFVKYESTSDASFADKRNATESPITGSIYGLEAAISYKGWRVNTGAEFQNIWTKFATNLQKDTTDFQAQVLSLVRIDGTTGNTLSTEKRDTFVNAVYNNTIVHYNNFQRLSIPLEVGHYYSNNKWSYGISAGTSFDFLLNQSGRISASNNEITTFDKNSENALFQSFGMSLRANLHFGYQINKHLMLTLSPRWSRSVQNILNDNMRAKVQQMNVTLGVRSVF